jgi:hypothetical protein
MLRNYAQAALLVAVCTISCPAAALAQGAIDVVGLDGTKTSVSLAGLERRTTNTADAAGIKTTYEGVAMRDVLIKAGVPMGDQLRGKALARVVIASAKDGYQVAYAIAELDPQFSDHVILIADRKNTQPLLPDSGPLQIVVPQDKRPARWVRQVIALEVRQLP